jgi:hypothetical protein
MRSLKKLRREKTGKGRKDEGGNGQMWSNAVKEGSNKSNK